MLLGLGSERLQQNYKFTKGEICIGSNIYIFQIFLKTLLDLIRDCFRFCVNLLIDVE